MAPILSTSLADGQDVMQAMTQFHYILMYPDSLKMINRVSQKNVQSLSLTASPGSTQGLAMDSSSATVYLYKGLHSHTLISTGLTGQAFATVSSLVTCQSVLVQLLLEEGICGIQNYP